MKRWICTAMTMAALRWRRWGLPSSVATLVWIASTVLLALPAGPAIAAPANDSFATAQDLGATSAGTTSGSSLLATTEASEPELTITGSTVWWRWTAPASGTLTVDTVGSNFDTTLTLFGGSTWPALTTLAFNDDTLGLQSRVALAVAQGTTYWVRVGGYFGNQGSIVLNWSLASTQSAQTIGFAALPSRLVSEVPFALSATATSGLPVTFSSTTTSVCRVSGNTVTLITGGACTLAANQAGNAAWLPAPQVSQSFLVTYSIQAGVSHVCAVTSGGAVRCWGSDATGQLGGRSSFSLSTLPIPVTGLSSGVVSIAAGDGHTCALSATGQVRCWGDNSYGQIGDGRGGSGFYGASPAVVTGLPADVVAITAGSRHTCALTGSGAVKCWGAGSQGELGNNSFTGSYTPVDVAGLASGVVKIDAGGSHTCAVKTDGSMVCWGWNDFGQLGNGSTTTGFGGSSTPVNVSGLSSGVVSISAGFAHTCAMRSAGDLLCWGRNNVAQLGNAAVAEYASSPVTVQGLGGVPASVSAGGDHTCVTLTSGAGQCWGRNVAGQLGDGTVSALSATPVNVALVSGLVSIAASSAGDAFSCAAAASGSVSCWGYGSDGEMGNGSNLGSITPVVSGMHLVQLAQSITPFPLADAPLRLNPYDFNQIDLTVVALPSLLASSGLQVSFDSTTPSVCSASVWTVYLISTGTCTVIANQAGDGTYAPAPQISQSFTVTPAFFSQTITFGALPNRQIGSAPFSVSATATSGATVRFTTLTPSTCSVTGTLVSLLAGGNCSIAADQAGGGAWLAAPQVVQSFTITLLTQTITFPALGNLTLGANPFVPTVSASSGLPVTLTSLTPTTCAVSGISVTLMAPGLCTLQADQAGSATFTAAAPVTQGFTVLGVAQGTLSYAAPLTTARYYHTATLLTNGKVLVAGGEDLAGEIATAEIYDPATNLWSPAGTLVTPRHRHTVTLLPNGKVLIVGGSALGQLLASSELYDPSTNTWTSTQGSLSVPRDGHTATLLSNGTVLVTNGEGSQGNVVSTELYDPSTGTWSPRAPMGMPHGNFATATLLANGKVLVVGGNDGTSTLASAELYDPSNNTWSSAGSMALPRSLHFATLLTSGKVLVATGGVNSNLLSSAELFDPATMSWSSAGAMANARMRSTVALLPNGKVWVAGGQDGSGGDVMSTELYDPASNGWSQAAPLSTPRTQATATLLPSGRVLVVGGNNWNFTELDSTEIFSMVSDAWDATPAPLLTGRFNQQNLLLLDGRVLSSGGRDGTTGAFQTTELRDPISGLWTPGPAMTAARQNHAATLLQTGEVFVSGGLDANNAALASTERWNPSGSGWVAATPMASSARFSHRQTLLGDGSVLVTGGQTSGSSASLATAERYNPTTGTWASAGTMTVPRVGHRATLLRDGRVLVSGGTSGTAYYANVDVYDPGADSWTALPPMSVPRGGHRVVLLPDGRVMVIGGQTTGGVYLDSVEIYDPANNAWSLTGSLSTARIQAAANVLPTGEVIVAGGTTTGGVVVASAERYDAVAGTWLPAGSLATARRVPGSVLLHDGRILYAGGAVNTGSATTNSVEVYRRDLGFDDAWRPVISTAPTTVGQGGKLYVTGSRFKGLSEASGGGNASRNSPTNHPIALLQRMDGGEQLWLGADALSSFGSTAFTSGPVTGMAAGPALLTVFANGIPSVAKAVVVGGSTTSSSVVLASSVNPSRVLSNTVLSVTVAGASPTGYVQFKDGGANLGGPVPVMDGTAQRIWSWPVVGTHAITAEYSGDANFAASTSGVLTQVVIPYLSTTTVSAQFYIPPSGGDVYAGGPWTARASVTGASPTGSVHFFAGAWDLGVATLQNGQAVLPDIIALRLTGVYSLSAIYSGDANNTASTSTNPVSVTVVRAFTVVELTGSSATAAAGESLTFLATVIGPDPGGLVQFKLDGVNFGSPVIMVGRVAQLTTSALPIGAHNLTAMYSGDQNNLGSTSTQLVVTIAAPTGDVPILPEWAAVLLGLLLLATVRRSGWR